MSNMKNKLIVHIGTHKTGTTSIQNTLEQNRALLAEWQVLYPRTDRDPWPDLDKHCSVYAAAVNSSSVIKSREYDLLMKEFEGSGCHTMILSEEGLSEPKEEIIDFFSTFKEHFDIEIVCYLRRQDLFLESLYNQFVRERARREGR